MSKKAFLIPVAAAAGLFFGQANATDWASQFELCSQAITDAGIANGGDYKFKFVSAGGGATKRLSVKLISENGGEDINVVCRIRRGEVTDVTVK